jgi:hypothetical protein
MATVVFSGMTEGLPGSLALALAVVGEAFDGPESSLAALGVEACLDSVGLFCRLRDWSSGRLSHRLLNRSHSGFASCWDRPESVVLRLPLMPRNNGHAYGDLALDVCERYTHQIE